MEEETGLATKVAKLLYVAQIPASDPPIIHISMLMEKVGGKLRLPTNEHDANPISDVRFVPIATLTEFGFSETFQQLAASGFPNAGSYVGSKHNLGL